MSRDHATRYRAFISYSHVDKKWGDWLHKALETYRVPKALVGQPSRTGPVPKTLYPIFRDREELPTATSLSEQIEQALEHSDYLIVICSPRSAKSMWVNEEILQFKRMGRSDRILAIVVDGEPNASDKPGLEGQECFPPALRFEIGEDGGLSDVRTEPIAADARKDRDGRQASKLKLIAGLIGVAYEKLVRRDHRRRVQRRISLVALTLIALATVAGVWYQGNLETRKQEHERLFQESSRLFELAQKELENGHEDRALLLALNGLPGVHGGESRPYLRKLAALGERAVHTMDMHSVLAQPSIQSFAYSRHGEFLAAGSRTGILRLFDPDDGSRAQDLLHGAPIEEIDIDSTGNLILVATGVGESDTYSSIVWDLQEGERIMSVEHKSQIGFSAFIPGSNEVVVVSHNGKSGITEVEEGLLDSEIRIIDPATQESVFSKTVPGYIKDVWVTPDGEMVAVTSDASYMDDYGRTVTRWAQTSVWHLPNGKLMVKLSHDEAKQKVAVFPDQKRLLTIGMESTVWDLASGEELTVLERGSSVSEKIIFANNGKNIIADRPYCVGIWETDSGALINEVCHEELITDFHYSDLMEKIVTADQAGRVSYWYTSWSDDRGSVFIDLLKDIEHDNRVKSVRLLSEQDKVAAAEEGLGIVVSSIQVPEEEAYWYGVYSSTSKVKLTHDDSNLIVFDTDEWASDAAFAIDLTTGAAQEMFGGAPVRWVTSGVLGATVYGLKESGRIASDAGGVVNFPGEGMQDMRRIEYVQESNSILAYSRGSGLARLDPMTGAEIANHETKRELRDMVLTQDGNVVLTIWETSAEQLSDDTLLVQRSSDFEVLASAKLLGADKIRISSSNNYALVSSISGEFWWVDVSTGNTIAEFIEGVSPIKDIAISNDEGLIAVAYGPLMNNAIVWSLEDDQIIGRYSHNDSVESISFSIDGTRLATASTDNSVVIWDLESGIAVYEFGDGKFYFVDFLPGGDLLFGDGSTLFRVATPPHAKSILASPFEALPLNRTCLSPEERDRFSLPSLSGEQWRERRCPQFANDNDIHNAHIGRPN